MTGHANTEQVAHAHYYLTPSILPHCNSELTMSLSVPLKERIVSTYTHKTSCIPRPVDRSRPVEMFCEKWRKNWTEEGMEQAIKSQYHSSWHECKGGC